MYSFLKRLNVFFILLFMSIGSVNATIFSNDSNSGPVSVDDAFIFNIEALDNNKYLLRWDILDDYYLYDNRMSFTVDDGVTITKVNRSKTKSKDDPLFGKVEVYYHSSEIELLFSSVDKNKTIELQIGYQGCWDGGVCYPPVSITKKIELFTSENTEKSSDINTKLVNVPNETELAAVPSPVKSEQDYFSDLLTQGNLFWIVGAFFLAGLALSLTPCVFPMIPIISSIIAGQGKDVSRKKAFYLSVIYVLSVAFTYTLAGIFAGLFGENLQILFQVPWIIALFSAIFVLLSLSMFGFYELQLPASLQSKLSQLSNNQEGGNYIGVSIMGVLSALIVGPCMAAPLAGALIYIGQTADPVLGGMALFALSLGMGVPLILVGVSAGHFMPKVGAWMNSVKAGFGVLLILMAIYMLDRIVSLEVTMFLVAITLMISSVYMGIFNLNNKEGHLKTFFKSIGLVIFLYGISLFLGTLIGGGNFIKPLKGLKGGNEVRVQKNNFNKVTSLKELAPILEEAKRNKKPVMLDFYADWCISCVELELMFEESEVSSALKALTLVKVDLTDFNDESKRLLEKYGVIGPPALIFYNVDGKIEKNMTIIGLVPAEKFIQHISVL